VPPGLFLLSGVFQNVCGVLSVDKIEKVIMSADIVMSADVVMSADIVRLCAMPPPTLRWI